MGALALLALSAVARAADDPEDAGHSRAPDPSWQLDSSVSGRKYSIQSVAPGPSVGGTAEQLGLTLVSFQAPLQDDGSPYSLEPFLQRTSQWSVGFGGGHFATHNPLGGPDRTDWNASVSGAVDVYVKRWLAVTGGLAYGYNALHDGIINQTTHGFSGFAGLGFRVRDTRLDASYTLSTQDVAGSFTPLRQSFGLSAFSVIARCFSVGLSGTLIPGGRSGELSLEYFPVREIGAFASAFGGKGKFYSDDEVFNRYMGSVGLAGWLDPTMGIVGQYTLTIDDLVDQLTGQSIVGYREVSHAILLEVYARFP
jgi:hypothetical protein